ncbi:lysylphosphatidylglycerol synthase transmembrane domain-containing protein [Pontibacillus sp. HMF3514]|uniref:lysylphosphatidylglycerol synthase transmembrane domain-containing protein n=1 Tax=Pontibacillus sp. HMF3514 TaxID=2692425 RepID=UPI0013201802|nr:lysylphosphatidylglycerol synthase transmembrane domain-containing protein [Pontibacillus sp. HMF3514]QHE50927.1 UPF0104 family protein [Pontibacillus sp. HMF3514]
MAPVKRYVLWTGRLVVGLCFIWLTYLVFDLSYILLEVKKLFSNFWLLLSMVFLYLLAFIFRAKAWQLYVNKHVGLRVFVDGVLYSLFMNHLLPVKAGDIIRSGYLARSKKVSWKTALESVFVMRLLDIIILGFIALIGILYLGLSLSYFFLMGLLIVGGLLLGSVLLKDNWRKVFINQVRKVHSILFSVKGIVILFLILISWCFEALIILAVTSQFSMSLSYLEAIWVNSFTIAGQVFHFSPGGIGTYESFMSFALRAFQIPMKEAYTIAVVTHGFKFIFSFVVGIYLIVSVPIPLKTIKSWLNRKEG